MTHSPIRTLLVCGTRPEAIKMAPLMQRLQTTPGVDARFCSTGQHREMLDQALSLFDLSPDFDLGIMRPGQDLIDVSSGVLRGLRDLFPQWQPDHVLVHGDTNTTAAAALASYYHRLDVARRLRTDLALNDKAAAGLHFIDPRRRLVLVTGHRRENFGQGFEDICLALRKLAAREEVQVVYPMHMNPAVREPVERLLADCPNVHLIEPLSYLPFVWLMEKSDFIITDSGGIQEEAPALGKPVLVMRDTTERPEAVAAGTVRLVGTNPERIVAEANRLLDDPSHHATMSQASNPYGTGDACQKICEDLLANTATVELALGPL